MVWGMMLRAPHIFQKTIAPIVVNPSLIEMVPQPLLLVRKTYNTVIEGFLGSFRNPQSSQDSSARRWLSPHRVGMFFPHAPLKIPAGEGWQETPIGVPSVVP